MATISHFKNSHRKQNKNLATTRTRIHNSSVDPSEIIYNNYDPLYSTFHKKIPKDNASTRHIGNKFYKTNVLANFQTSRPNNNLKKNNLQKHFFLVGSSRTQTLCLRLKYPLYVVLILEGYNHLKSQKIY